MKIKGTATIEWEYTLYPKLYPKGSSLEEMLQIDKKNIEEDPSFLLENEDIKLTINLVPERKL